MTVTVNKPTPGRPYSSSTIVRSLWDALPFEIEVTGPHPRKEYAATCQCTEVYRITADGVAWLSKRGLIRQDLRKAIEAGKLPCVCRCML